jgi:hypothetical protein
VGQGAWRIFFSGVFIAHTVKRGHGWSQNRLALSPMDCVMAKDRFLDEDGVRFCAICESGEVMRIVR